MLLSYKKQLTPNGAFFILPQISHGSTLALVQPG